MQTFSKRVLIDEGFTPSFYFTKIYTIKGVRFHVSVIDLLDRAHNFNMVLKNLEWKIINGPEVPCWIMNVEQQLEEVILEHLADYPERQF